MASPRQPHYNSVGGAPAIMIDTDIYGNVTPDKIERIVEKYK